MFGIQRNQIDFQNSFFEIYILFIQFNEYKLNMKQIKKKQLHLLFKCHLIFIKFLVIIIVVVEGRKTSFHE